MTAVEFDPTICVDCGKHNDSKNGSDSCKHCRYLFLVDWVQVQIEKMNFLITLKQEIQSGTQFRTRSGQIINVYTTGRILFQGKENNHLKDYIIKNLSKLIGSKIN